MRRLVRTLAGSAVIVVLFSLKAHSTPASAVLSDKPDYTGDLAWLCRPDRSDACSEADLSTTVIAANGQRHPEQFVPAQNPGFDCFYVYPTASKDKTSNSDLDPGKDEEIYITQKQAARFREVCRVFVPLYRQLTLNGAVNYVRVNHVPPSRPDEIAYRDVMAAWKTYLANDNDGRAFVLIGHSQGALILMRLLQEEIDGKPVQGRMISVLLLGRAVAVPRDRAAGGDFTAIPLCGAVAEFGCIVTYSSFRKESPPPPDSLFGRLPPDRAEQFAEEMTVGCTNPVALAGGKNVVQSYFDTANRGNFHVPPDPWTVDNKPIDTPFVRVPGLLSAECVTSETGSYIAIAANPEPGDMRTRTFPGDTVMNGVVQKNWGLHSIEMDLFQGNLITLVAHQAAAWKRVSSHVCHEH